MAVHVHNISLVLMNNNFEPNWLLHATAAELHLDGSIVHNTKSLIVTAALNDAQVGDLKENEFSMGILSRKFDCHSMNLFPLIF